MIEAKQAFFDSMEAQGLALTFDDVRLRTQSTPDAPLPKVIDISSRFSRNVELKTPFVSAAMDTVTTSKMAIAMAKLGGIGVIHAALSPREQKEEVRRVKRHLSGLISDPIMFDETRSLESVLKECEDRRLDFRTFPIVDNIGQFVGLLTQSDFDFCGDFSQSIGAVMTPASEVTHAPATTDVDEAYEIMVNNKKKTLPLLEEGKVAGLYVFSDVSRIARRDDAASYNVDSNGRLRVAAAVPTNSEALERIREMHHYLDAVVIDTADGDSHHSFKTLEDIKSEFPNLDVVVGNISEGKSAKELVAAGADGIKVGQGPGSICTTRIETGIGTPQVTAVYNCAKAVGDEVPVCADGGIRNHGDISIAIAAGANSVMMGSMLAGTEEAPGEIFVDKEGNRRKSYRGMGSASALRDNAASRARYEVSGNGSEVLAEGIEAAVPYKGSVVSIVDMCAAALRKSMRYVKAVDIKSHQNNTVMFRITNAGLRESHPHDVEIITT